MGPPDGKTSGGEGTGPPSSSAAAAQENIDGKIQSDDLQSGISQTENTVPISDL